MPIKSDKAKRSLVKKGYKKSDTHHRYYRYHHNDVLTESYTLFSHGSSYDISNELLSKMRIQLRMDTIQQVRDLLNCPMKEEDLINILRNNGVLDEENKISD